MFLASAKLNPQNGPMNTQKLKCEARVSLEGLLRLPGIEQWIDSIWLVGSRARGDYGLSSDHDFIVVPKRGIYPNATNRLRSVVPKNYLVETLAGYGGGGKRRGDVERSNQVHLIVLDKSQVDVFPERKEVYSS